MRASPSLVRILRGWGFAWALQQKRNWRDFEVRVPSEVSAAIMAYLRPPPTHTSVHEARTATHAHTTAALHTLRRAQRATLPRTGESRVTARSTSITARSLRRTKPSTEITRMSRVRSPHGRRREKAGRGGDQHQVLDAGRHRCKPAKPVVCSKARGLPPARARALPCWPVFGLRQSCAAKLGACHPPAHVHSRADPCWALGRCTSSAR